MRKIFKNKNGKSKGFLLVFGLVTLYGLGLLYIIFNQVFVEYLVPIIKNMTNSSTYMGSNITQADTICIHADIDKYMGYFNMVPFILFFVVVAYMIIAAMRKERDNEYR